MCSLNRYDSYFMFPTQLARCHCLFTRGRAETLDHLCQLRFRLPIRSMASSHEECSCRSYAAKTPRSSLKTRSSEKAREVSTVTRGCDVSFRLAKNGRRQRWTEALSLRSKEMRRCC